jgi:hypothetical protein
MQTDQDEHEREHETAENIEPAAFAIAMRII